jgi:hypothetical protein
MGIIIKVEGYLKFTQICKTPSIAGLSPSAVERGKDGGGQDADYGNDDQEFDEGESAVVHCGIEILNTCPY